MYWHIKCYYKWAKLIFIILPLLLRQIEASILDNFVSNISTLSLSAEIGVEDYIKVGNIEMIVQNFSNVHEIESYNKVNNFGLTINNKTEFINLTISY